jgi:hypothetical protein
VQDQRTEEESREGPGVLGSALLLEVRDEGIEELGLRILGLEHLPDEGERLPGAKPAGDLEQTVEDPDGLRRLETREVRSPLCIPGAYDLAGLQRTREALAAPSGAARDGVHTSAAADEEVDDAVGLSEVDRPENDR